MVWARISTDGKIDLIILRGRITSLTLKGSEMESMSYGFEVKCPVRVEAGKVYRVATMAELTK